MTIDFKEVKHTVDNLESLIKVDRLESIISLALEKAIEKGKGHVSDYGKHMSYTLIFAII